MALISMTILAVLFAFTAAAGWGFALGYKHDAAVAERVRERQHNHIETLNREMRDRLAEIHKKHEWNLAQQERKFEAERGRYLEQIQALANRVATLRNVAGEGDGVVVGGDEPFLASTPDPLPYEPELQEFVDGITSEEGRLMVIEDIETWRATGMADEQILNKVAAGERIE